MLQQAHLFVQGRVQGVFFRAFTRKVAAGLGLNGWVRNLYDGRVEAVIEGERDLLDQAIRELRKGPPGSYVQDIDITWGSASGEAKGFEIRY